MKHDESRAVIELDAVVIGAGFSGLYALHRLRDYQGLNVRVVEATQGVGGTWNTNRYPGARCDTESWVYCYSFSQELLKSWRWTSRYPKQAELLRYFEHVTDRFDLRKDIAFSTRVVSAKYVDARARWLVHTDRGDVYECRYLVSAMGTLSAAPYTPTLAGIDDFAGEWHHTGAWPTGGVDLAGKRVAVIGTGSTGVQTIPVIACEAEHLYVVQRSPQYTVPARHVNVDDEMFRDIQARYDDIWTVARRSAGGFPWEHNGRSALDESDDQLRETLEALWAEGGLKFVFGSYRDLLTDIRSNDKVASFVREKIAGRIDDPSLAAKLTPTHYPFGARRPIVDTEYFETFSRDNVTLLDLREEPIVGATVNGLRTTAGEYPVDVIVFATGFDAVTGPYLKLDIRGVGGLSLGEKWADGPSNYLGLMQHDFPNLFTITGPGSTFGNHAVNMEFHVEWIADCIGFMRREGIEAMDPRSEAEDAWGAEMLEQVNQTVIPGTDSWWTGANIPGKQRRPLFSVGSYKYYRRRCERAAADKYLEYDRHQATNPDSKHRSKEEVTS